MMRPFLSALFLLFSLNTFAQGSLEGDRLALVALSNSGGGSVSNWVVPGSPGDNPCGWEGVTCIGGRVTRLDISNEPISYIPPEIGNLTELTYLDLAGIGREFSNLSGSIPAEISNLTKLEHLDLSYNDFDPASIPVIGTLVSLKYLDITPDWNIPDEFGNLVNLEYLYLRVDDPVGLTPGHSEGDIPVSFGNLTKLKVLNMHNAGIIGPIPPTLTNLINLEILDLSDNKLSGNIPVLSGIPMAADVNISSNSFTFAGLETNINIIDQYIPQSVIPLIVSPAFPLPYIISAEAGGNRNNNTYKFFKDGVLIATTVRYSDQFIEGGGYYKMEVTNSLVPNLTLFTEELFIPKGAMPVTLISFSGKNSPLGNQLVWKTTSETSNSGFEIEKSPDAKTFEKIGFVDGNGDSKETNTYSFTDPNPLSRTYYRLKQLDYDGKYEYSKVISVKNEGSILAVYPNPAADLFYVKGLSRKENVAIRNLQGGLVLSKGVSPAGYVNTENLSNGIYVITVGNETTKLMIRK